MNDGPTAGAAEQPPEDQRSVLVETDAEKTAALGRRLAALVVDVADQPAIRFEP